MTKHSNDDRRLGAGDDRFDSRQASPQHSEHGFAAGASLAVDVEHLSRRFRGRIALDDVTLKIPIGSVFGLVGLNGAGKTTLIRHLIGSLRAQHGRVRVLNDDPVRHPHVVLKNVGYLTEEDSLPKWMRVGDLIDFARALYPNWDDGYAKELCELFGLRRSDSLRVLSKGGRARAGLLVAIAHRPQLLVLDEPSSGLDPIARSDILEAIIRTVNEEGRTVLFSSHLLDEVDRVCDTVALIHQGRIIETITIEQLESRYCEILFRASRLVATPPPLEAAFGWRQRGREWSAVFPLSVQPADDGDNTPTDFDPTAQLGDDAQWSFIQRRAITLDRWFAACVGPAADFNDAVPQESSVDV